MSLPANFPVSLDALANPGVTTNRDDPGFELDLVISRLHDIAEALESKLGIGASVPSANTVLRGTGAGSTAYGQIQANDIAAGQALQKIGLATLAAPNTIIDFTSIPQTFSSLRLIVIARGLTAAINDTLIALLNSSSIGYYTQILYGAGTTAGAIESLNTTYANLATIPAGNAPTAEAAVLTVDLPGYASGFTKPLLVAGAGHWNVTTGTIQARMTAAIWNNVAPITSIRLQTLSGGTFAIGTTAALYGL